MFSALGLFKNIPCPRQNDCILPSCIFSHIDIIKDHTIDDVTGFSKEYDPFSAGDVSPPDPKRRRIELAEVEVEGAVSLLPTSRQVKTETTKLEGQQLSVQHSAKPLLKNDVKPLAQILSPVLVKQPKPSPKSMERKISPPPKRKSKLPNQQARKAVKVESLTPRTVAKAPALLKTRLSVLQALHKQIQDQNRKLATMNDERKALVLGEQEVICLALDEEETATKLGDDIYRNAMAQKVLRIKKMTTDEWIEYVNTWIGNISQSQSQDTAQGNFSTASFAAQLSVPEEIAVLRHLRTPLEGLEGFGYVTRPPTVAEVTAAKAAAASAAGFEKCDRCGTRFQVFPGRDEGGRLTSHGRCWYHWAKPNRAGGSKTDKIIGKSEASFPCCNRMEGSEGCTEGDTHVFNVKHPSRLASIFQFEHTPQSADAAQKTPLSFDCEMGYTTLGMEVIRLTAVAWPEGNLVLDFLVRPYGEILDLNTRFSGVTKEAYAAALEYESGVEPQTARLRKVSSPAAARQLLFEHLTPDTPLLGHAIDNDLNVCRIIHPFVVDTVLLYPHPRGLPIRFSLKILAQKYLSRGIQSGGEAGHDSKEDAVATGDLVRKQICEVWSRLQYEGWKFVNGILEAPNGANKVDSRSQSLL